MKVKFAERLKELREEKGISRYRLAKIMDVTQTTTFKWEKGQTRPGYETLIRLCEIFDCTMGYLIGTEDV